jgi:hypothetical protein
MWTQMSVSLCDENLITIAILVSLTHRNEDYEMIGIDCYILRLDAGQNAQKNAQKCRAQIFKLGVGRCVLGHYLS